MLQPIPLIPSPTPLQPLPRLSAEVGVDLWVKRDDLTGFATSGNKIRKLEWLVADALNQGADTLITCGGIQSNHARATAAVARRLGLDPVLLLRGEEPAVPDGNLLIDVLLGAELRWCTAEDYAAHRGERMQAIADEVVARGRRPYVIPEGGSTGLGALGFEAAVREVEAQDPRSFDTIVCAVGSGGTLAGLVLGRPEAHVRGYAVCDDAPHFVGVVHRIAEELERAVPPCPERWSVNARWRGEAYGVANADVWATIARVARVEGLLLDPTYTGKAFHGMLHDAVAGRLGQRVLFWHTGGAFGLFGRGAEVPWGRSR